ncbi:MAG: LPP20 family lipoprotein [bacterium]|nr:LPP20 family lipoprotein [Myxococcales bacterium]MCB9551382.1 LPP20 family lipoprotein [Myxococcales bacterium]
MKTPLVLKAAGLGVLLLLGCGGDQVQSDGVPEDVPKWAMTPPEACGVGIAKHRGNLGMAKTTAEARGRDALARELSTKVEGMIKDYQQSGETDGKDFTEELTTQVSRQIVDQTLVGTRTRIAHVSKENPQQYYALVCLDPESFAGAFDRMNELSQKQRQALKARADAEFKDLDQQLDRLQNQ